MKQLRVYIELLFIPVLFGCASPSYYLDFGIHGIQYKETLDAPLDLMLEAATGKNVTMIEGDPNGVELTVGGFQFGLVERSKSWSTRISYFMSVYPEAVHRFDMEDFGSITQSVEGKSSGIEITMGPQFSVFNPFFYYRRENYEVDSKVSGGANWSISSRSSFALLGAGLGVDIPMTKKGSGMALAVFVASGEGEGSKVNMLGVQLSMRAHLFDLKK